MFRVGSLIGPVVAPRGRCPAGFLGMLALILAAEAGLTWIGHQVRGRVAADWWEVRRSAGGAAAVGAEILCLGDSLIKTGVAPAALEARLDRSAYNLAALAAPTPATYAVFRRALAAGARPRAIVLDANEPQLWGSYYRSWASGWAELLEPAEALQLARDDDDLGFFGLYLVHHLVPSARFRDDIRAAILGWVAGYPTDTLAPWPEVLERHYRRNRGGFVFPVLRTEDAPELFPDGELPAFESSLCYRTGPFARPTNLVYLDRIITLAASRGITVFFVIPPFHPGVLAVRERLGLEAQYVTLIKRVCDRYGNVVVVDGRHAGFDDDVFIDSCHMNIRGASAFSHALAETMAMWLDGPPGGDRWRLLPAYAEPSARLAVEDLHESQFTVSWLRGHR